MNKRIFIAFGSLFVIVAAAAIFARTGLGRMTAELISPPPTYPVAANTKAPASTVEIQGGVFSPNSLLATQGQDITLQLHAVDNDYGFTMPDLGLDITVPQGQTVIVRLPTTNLGVFRFWDGLHPEQGDWTTWQTRGTFTVTQAVSQI